MEVVVMMLCLCVMVTACILEDVLMELAKGWSRRRRDQDRQP